MTVDACSAHAHAITNRLRFHDAVRLNELTDGCSGAALSNAIKQSALTWCGLDDDLKPVTLGGVIERGNETGYVWQVAAFDLGKHKRSYLLQGKQMLQRALERFARLETRIAADYPEALRHVRRFGWTVEPRDVVLTIPSHLCVRVR